MNFETGNLTTEEVEAIFNNLPVDITFVGKDDTVRYFSQTKDRIFPRAKAIIGKTVQNCHPRKSVDKVNQIVSDFKSKKQDTAEFWINMQGKVIYIRYFAVHDNKGEYIGTMEVTQDITGIQKIKGEKRLMD
jgi:PAS domain S-box-containing protein